MSDQNIAPIYGVIESVNQEAPSYPASNIIDGSLSGTEYRSVVAQSNTEWIIIDLGAEYALSGFKVWSCVNTNINASMRDYRIGTSNTPDNFVIITSGQLPKPAIVAGKGTLTSHETSISITARYVKIYLDNNWFGLDYISLGEFEIFSSVVQQTTGTFISNAEIYKPSEVVTVTSDAYIIPAPTITKIISVKSDAEITDTRTDILSDVTFVYGNNMSSDSHIWCEETATVQSDAMIYRSGSAIREVFTMGKGSSEGFPYSGSTLIYCTDISSSDEVVVADMITSTVMDMADVTPPLGYQNYNWKYDWVVRAYDSAQYKFEIRTGKTPLDLSAATFSPIVLGQVISIGEVPRYHQWRCHIWASGSGDFELHQFSIKGYIDHPVNPLYSSLNPGEFTTVSKVETGVNKPYEPMDMDSIWGGTYIPGDVDGNGVVNYDDLLYLIAWQYSDGPAPKNIRWADVNDSGGVNGDDIVYLTAYLYTNGAPPYRRDAGGLE